MANNVTAFIQLKYAQKKIQMLLQEKLIATDLANTTLLSDMPNGNTINFPKPTYLPTQTYVPYTPVSYGSIIGTNEQLVINQTPLIAFQYDVIDEEDEGWDVVGNTLMNSAFLLKEFMDGDFFNQYQYANLVYNGGTAVTLTATNAFETYSNAYALLTNQGVDENNLVLVTDQFQRAVIGQQAVNSRFALGDEAMQRGWTRTDVSNMTYFTSNNLTCVGSFIFGAQPSDGDTITFAGAVFTFKTSLGSTPGNVLIGANAAAAQANFIAAFNGAAGAGSTYVALTQEEQESIRLITATSVSTSAVFTSKRGYRPVAKVMTSGSNKFGQFVIYNLAMERGSIFLVLRDMVRMRVGELPGTFTKEYLLLTRYGLKVFTQGAQRMIVIPVVARAAD